MRPSPSIAFGGGSIGLGYGELKDSVERHGSAASHGRIVASRAELSACLFDEARPILARESPRPHGPSVNGACDHRKRLRPAELAEDIDAMVECRPELQKVALVAAEPNRLPDVC